MPLEARLSVIPNGGPGWNLRSLLAALTGT
jgi:hypothetical protein